MTKKATHNVIRHHTSDQKDSIVFSGTFAQCKRFVNGRKEYYTGHNFRVQPFCNYGIAIGDYVNGLYLRYEIQEIGDIVSPDYGHEKHIIPEDAMPNRTILHSLPVHAHNLLKWQGLTTNEQIIAHMKSDTLENLAYAAVNTAYSIFKTVKYEEKVKRAIESYGIISQFIANF